VQSPATQYTQAASSLNFTFMLRGVGLELFAIQIIGGNIS